MRRQPSDLALFDTSSLSFTRRARVAADRDGTFVNADHAFDVATAMGEASASDVRAAYGLAPRTDGFVSFEVSL